MSDRPIEGLMDTTLDKIKQMVDVNTVIGTPITSPDGTTVIPVSKVMYGFTAGGSEFNPKKAENKNLFEFRRVTYRVIFFLINLFIFKLYQCYLLYILFCNITFCNVFWSK